MSVTAFNYIEAILWFTIGCMLFINARFIERYLHYRKIMYMASIFFILFGISDIIEVQTGAWWKPTGLLVLNVVCIAGFVYCWFKYLQNKRKHH